MKARKGIRAGFTLVEILIVVVILGILAAIVIPQFTSASEAAKGSSVVTQLQTIRAQLELYQIQHNGNYPTLAQMFTNLITETEVDGTAGNASGNEFGPYVQQAPNNPFTLGSSCAADNSGDWEYTAATGSIRAVLSAAKITELNLSASDAVAAP